MDIKEIITELQKWQGEDKENRGVIIITSECISKSMGGGERISASTAGVVGSEGQLVPAIANALVKNEAITGLFHKAAAVAASGIISKTIKDENLS